MSDEKIPEWALGLEQRIRDGRLHAEVIEAQAGDLESRIKALEARAGQTVDLDKYELRVAQIRELYEASAGDIDVVGLRDKMVDLWPWLKED